MKLGIIARKRILQLESPRLPGKMVKVIFGIFDIGYGGLDHDTMYRFHQTKTSVRNELVWSWMGSSFYKLAASRLIVSALLLRHRPALFIAKLPLMPRQTTKKKTRILYLGR